MSSDLRKQPVREILLLLGQLLNKIHLDFLKRVMKINHGTPPKILPYDRDLLKKLKNLLTLKDQIKD